MPKFQLTSVFSSIDCQLTRDYPYSKSGEYTLVDISFQKCNRNKSKKEEKVKNESMKLLGNFVPRGFIHSSDHLNQISIFKILCTLTKICSSQFDGKCSKFSEGPFRFDVCSFEAKNSMFKEDHH